VSASNTINNRVLARNPSELHQKLRKGGETMSMSKNLKSSSVTRPLTKGAIMGRYAPLLIGILGVLLVGACGDIGTATEPVTGNDATALSASNRAPRPGTDSIAAIAEDAGFSELLAALSYVDAELETELVNLFSSGKDQYTVFAPTNTAFENLYSLLSDVLETEINEITDIPADIVLDVLLYHVTEGRRAANSVVPRNGERKITSLLEEIFSVRTDLTIRDGLTGLRDNDAEINTPNISASNGIIHVITEVIVPPSVVAQLTS
jgi:uncharacterized surface protein with fasciclin (FAS1) repeats